MVIFKRELKSGDILQGSDIKDTAVSPQFGDIYDGQITFLPKYEKTVEDVTLSIGEVPMGNTYASGNYIIEAPVKRKPLFGSGILKGLDLNLYHNKLNYNMEQSLPDIEVYKFTRTIGDLVQGNFGRPRTENVIVGSTTYSKTGSSIEETFTGGDPMAPGGATDVELTDQFYMFSDDAYAIQRGSIGHWHTCYTGSSGWGYDSQADFEARYCWRETSGGPYNICRLREDTSVPGDMWVEPTKGVRSWRDDPQWGRGCIDYAWCEKKDFWEHYVRNYVYYNTVPTGTAWDVDSYITPENSIFDVVYTQGDEVGTVEPNDEFGNPMYVNSAKAVFSNASSSGNCMLMNTSYDASITSVDKLDTNQIVMGYFRLPKPLQLIRERNSEDAINSLEVDIKFNIQWLTKMHKNDVSVEGGTMVPYGLNMLRSFVIMAATRPPDQEEMEDFGKYIHNLNGPSDCSHTTETGSSRDWTSEDYTAVHGNTGLPFFESTTKDKDNPISGQPKNNYNGVCMMNWHYNDAGTAPVQSANEHPSGGNFGVSWSSASTYTGAPKRRGGWGSIRSGLTGLSTGGQSLDWRGDTSYMPYVPKSGCVSYADDEPTNSKVPASRFFTPLSNVDSTDKIAFVKNNWYTWKMIINYKNSSGVAPLDQLNAGSATVTAEGDITWILLDSNNKVVTSRKQKHVGYRSAVGSGPKDLAPQNMYGDVPTDMSNEKSGFPAYVSIWLLNMGKGGLGEIDADTDDDTSLWTTPQSNTSSRVLIDSIKLSGFEPNTSNATIGPRNTSKSPLAIPSITEDIIDTDGGGSTSFTEREFPPYLSQTIPSYISWGMDIDELSSNVNNIFLGDFTNDNPLFNDYSDSDKTIKVLDRSDGGGYSTFSGYGGGVASTDSNIILKIPNTQKTGTKKLGAWTCAGGNANLAVAPHYNHAIYLDSPPLHLSANYVDDLTKKGFITIDFSSAVANPGNEVNGGDYIKRENPLFSTKILEVINPSTGKIRVANPAILNGFYDDEFIVYRTGYNWNNGSGPDYAKTGLKVIGTSTLSNTIQLNGSILESDGETDLADSNDYHLHELYISPYRFWWALEIFNISETDSTPLPGKSYSFSVIQSPEEPNSPMPWDANNIFGMTYNESLYSDTSSLSNKWKLYKSTTGALVETGVDYGFGATGNEETIDDEVGTGYIRKYIPQEGYMNISLDGLVDVESDRLEKPDEKISLYIKASDGTLGSCALRSTKAGNISGEPSDPYFTFYYLDEKPTIENFSVKPNEVDPFYPTFTWETQDDDLWYGFLLLSNNEIKHQYDGAVAHIPLNETNVTDKDKIYLYRYDGNNGGVGVTADSIGINNLTTVEGLAGNAFKCEGNNTAPSFITWPKSVASHSTSGSYTQPVNEFSLVTHFTCDSIAANRYIVSKSNEFEIYIGTNGNVNATLTPGGGLNTVALRSSTVVNTDGETPTNAILTFDNSIPTGNVKLFINGKLEDQSGIKTATGSVNNWKAGESLNNDRTTYLTIGMRGNTGSETVTPGSELINSANDRTIAGGTINWVKYNPASATFTYDEDTTAGDIHITKPVSTGFKTIGIELPVAYYTEALVEGELYRLSAKMWIDPAELGVDVMYLRFQLGPKEDIGSYSTYFAVTRTPQVYTADIVVTDPTEPFRIVTADNWYQNDSSHPLWHMDDFSIKGAGSLENPSGDSHSGTIEEVVLYNRVIYPVVPQTGEMTFYKPIFELTRSDIQSGISNVGRLFVKDYHNIRGTLANDVAASSMVSYRKSGLGLKSLERTIE